MKIKEKPTPKEPKPPKKLLKIQKRQEDPDNINPNSDLTDKEIKVLELYFSGIPLSQAVRKAGYKSKDPQTRVFIGNRILEKYECQAGGKEIFRRVGLGEARLAMQLRWVIEELERNYRETGNLTALRTLKDYMVLQSKCLGLHRDVLETLEAPVILVDGKDDEAQAQALEDQQSRIRARLTGEGKPASGQVVAMEITK